MTLRSKLLKHTLLVDWLSEGWFQCSDALVKVDTFPFVGLIEVLDTGFFHLAIPLLNQLFVDV